ncbi:MAG: hypothetical protein CMN32_05505 [Saprospirales bacterium]|nr:hypothetical protein [Saprospirales bacterium]
MEEIVALVAVVGTFTSIIFFIYLFFTSRHKIRMALIEHNKEAGIFRSEHNGSSALKWGMVAVGVGLGLILGSALESDHFEAPLPHFSMMLIMGGLGLITYYLLIRKNNENDIGDGTV